MKTISSHVQSWLDDHPFTADHLARGLINHSSLARTIKPEIKSAIGEDVSIEAVTMALNRIGKDSQDKIIRRDYEQFISDVSLQTDLSLVAFNTKKLKLSQLPKKPEQPDDIFITIRGVWHTEFIAKTSLIDNHDFPIKPNVRTDNLASLTIRLNPEHIPVPGVGAYILARVAAKNISLEDVISAHNEFILLLDKSVAQEALKALI